MSGILAFDPDAYLARASAPERPADLFATPPAWKRGLEVLVDWRRPSTLSTERWEQIASDATKIATIWCDMAVMSGWSIEELFGFDDQKGAYGLAFALCGRRLVSLDASARDPLKHRYAAMRDGDRFAWAAADIASGAPLIWTFTERNTGSR